MAKMSLMDRGKTIPEPTTHCQWHNTCHLNVKNFRFALYLKQVHEVKPETHSVNFEILRLTDGLQHRQKGPLVGNSRYTLPCHRLVVDDTLTIFTGPITLVPPYLPS